MDGQEPTPAPEAGRAGMDPAARVYLTTLRHDLRAPIGAIVGYAELLAEDLADSPDSAFLDDLGKIHAAGRSLLEIVDHLFDPAAIAAGRLDLDRAGSLLHHELRTPLNHVIGYSEMLLEEAEGEGRAGVAADLQRIRTSGLKVLAMIDEVLERAPASDARPAAASEEAPLSGVARGVVADLEAFGTSRSVPEEELQGRILVVDDNELNRDMLARRVRAQGHEAATAANGEEALAALHRHEFDAVLLDIVMPDLNGYEVLRRIKGDARLREIPVIMISALDEVESAVRCIEMGAEDYLPKPFNPVILKARLSASLEKKRFRDREALHLQRIEAEQRRSDELLHVIFPGEIVRELKATSSVRPRRYEDVAVLFSDIVAFTRYSEPRDPQEVIDGLQRLVQEQEELCASHGLEKIKTIGDSFMAAAGLLTPLEDPVLTAVRCGLEMIDAARRLPPHWDLRVGVHAGPLVGGVLGRRQYLFDLIGDTVNTAAFVVRHGRPGSVNMSAPTWRRIERLGRAESLGFREVKGKGALELMRFVGFA